MGSRPIKLSGWRQTGPDERHDFKGHMAALRLKLKVKIIIREVKGILGVESKKVFQLYVTLARSIMEYGNAVWQVVPQDDLAPLERVQRKALCLCLRLPSTACREAMEVASGTIPLDLRDIGKTAAKRNDESVKKLLNDYLESETGQSRHVTPVGGIITEFY